MRTLHRHARRMLALLPLAGFVAACDGSAERPAGVDSPPIAVEALRARSGAVPQVERVNGTIRAADQVEIRPEIEARVVAVRARSGDRVQRGATLFRLDDSALAEQLRQAEAAERLAAAGVDAARARVVEAEAIASRTRALAAEGLASALDDETGSARLAAARADLAEDDARVEQARAETAERRAALERATVRSPVSGRVGRIDVRPGQLVDSATLLTVVGGLDRLIVEFRLTEAQLALVEPGDRAVIRARDTEIEARVARISPFLAQHSFSTVAEIDLEGSGFAPGTFVTVDLYVGEEGPGDAVLVPLAALHEDPDDGSIGLWVLDLGGRDPPGAELGAASFPTTRRVVRVIAEGGGVAAIAGVAAGDWVVVNGQHLLAAAEDATTRARAADWDRILELQQLQREDVLAEFLAKQQRMAAETGRAPRPGEPASP